MNARIFAAAASAALLAAAAPRTAAAAPSPVRNPSQAASSDDDNPFVERDRAAAPDLKTPCHLWGAPAEDDPASQLARARAFEARGRRKAARKAYDALVHNWGTSAEAPVAQLSVARLREAAGDLEEAFTEYQYYLERYAGSNPAPGYDWLDVVRSQYGIASALLPKSGRGPFSVSPGLVASMFRHVVLNAPDWEKAPEAALQEGHARERDHDWDAAVAAYDRLMAKYPASRVRVEACYRAGECRWRVSEKWPNDERALVNALETMRRALRLDPSHTMAPETSRRVAALSARATRMAWERAEFYDRIRKNPDAARLAYAEFLRLYPAAKEAPAARARLAELEAGRPAAAPAD